jgi:hypothetical protein
VIFVNGIAGPLNRVIKEYLLLGGEVIPLTKITANPRPIEASIFLDIAKNEHIPKK